MSMYSQLYISYPQVSKSFRPAYRVVGHDHSIGSTTVQVCAAPRNGSFSPNLLYPAHKVFSVWREGPDVGLVGLPFPLKAKLLSSELEMA